MFVGSIAANRPGRLFQSSQVDNRTSRIIVAGQVGEFWIIGCSEQGRHQRADLFSISRIERFTLFEVQTLLFDNLYGIQSK